MEPWIRFANLQLAPRIANSLLDRFGTPDAVFAADLDEVAGAVGMTGKQVIRLGDASFLPTRHQLDYIERHQVRVVVRGADDYPRNLHDIADAPPVLFVRGDLAEKDRFCVAVVGSRHASPYGRTIAARLARDLADAGITVVSGGAVGIDTAAHHGAVGAGGRTLAVLGCGLDIDYPRDNHGLFEQIACGRGALLSEFPVGATPEPWRFPMRNRIISGISMGVVVVEAGAQSGALLTAGIAGEQGRDVMAVPGNVDRPGCKGTNGLIKDGAALVEDARDVMRALGMLVLEPPPGAAPAARPLPDLPAQRRRVLECLTLSPKHLDAIAAELKMSTSEAGVELTMLEVSGLVRRLPGNCYIRAL